MARSSVKPPTIFGRRMRNKGPSMLSVRLGELEVLIWHPPNDGAPWYGQAFPLDGCAHANTATAVASKLEAWVVRHLLGKTLGAMGFEARRVRS